MKVLFLLFLILSPLAFSESPDSELYQIYKDGLTGYIDSSGRQAIAPTFWSADIFSEGLAAARKSGKYGYINRKGDYVIDPQFDYGLPFSDGRAIVFVDGKPSVINKDGAEAFKLKYPIIDSYRQGLARVQTSSGNVGYIDRDGAPVVKAIYTYAGEFIKGYALVKKGKKTGIIDENGNFVISLGEYSEIEDYSNGYFKVDIPTADGSRKAGFVDTSGNLIFEWSYQKNCWISGPLQDNMVRVSLYNDPNVKEEKVWYSSEYSYTGYLNFNGELVIDNLYFKGGHDFSNDLAFVKYDRDFYLINKKGERISDKTYSQVVGGGFKNGMAFVRNGKIGIIDTEENFVLEPMFNYVESTGIFSDHFFYYEYTDTEDSYGSTIRYGISNYEGETILEPIMNSYDMNGFSKGVLKCIIDDKLTYINRKGEIIWQIADSDSSVLKNINIDYMNRGYFYAYSTRAKGERGGGWYISDNFPIPIESPDHYPKEELAITVKPDQSGTLEGGYDGIPVYISNTTEGKVQFNAQDSRLYMKVQALDVKNNWRDIEYIPDSWCGNSYHTLELESNHYWSFLTPRYQGDFKTKLRIELSYVDPDNEEKEIKIYSKPYPGSINNAQFWRKQGYFPSGIMDPYNN